MKYAIGIDSGSVATKTVLFDLENNTVAEHVILPTGWSPLKSAKQACGLVTESKNISKDDCFTVATGYGRVSLNFADKTVSEITCHAKGAFFLNNETRTIIDIGGQDSKVIKINDKGRVVDFLMNDKCAAGTGRFLQVIINSLGEDISALDQLTCKATPKTINSMCTVFAESEVIGLLASGCAKDSVALGVVHSIASRTVSLVSKLSISEKVQFTGGLAKSGVIKKVLAEKLQTDIYRSPYSQIAGAIGAAIIGGNECKKTIEN
jgi:(R)-2-hydroxyacyl-CoA dehydratese activating ATPase